MTENIEYQTQRIRLAFNKASRQQLFTDFGAHNSRLRDILGSSDRLAGLRQARVSKSSVDAGLWKFWNHGNLLFNLLTEAWSCKCQALHHANLLLQHRPAATVNFRVVFWFKRQLAAETYPWSWQDTSIKLLEEASTPTALSINVPSHTNAHKNGTALSSSPISAPALGLSSPGSTQGNNVAMNSKHTHKSYGKSFMDKLKSHKALKTSSLVKAETKSPAMLSNLPVPAIHPNMEAKSKLKLKVAFANVECQSKEEAPKPPKITDLCTKITSCSADLPKYGCLKGDELRYLVQPIDKAATEPQQYITLDALLSASSSNTFTRRQRLQVAVILASSHIQLHPTPWLKSKWSKKDILFLYDPKDCTKLCVDHPYISRSLSKLRPHSSPTVATPASNMHIFQDSIRNLGIILLELCFGTAVEDHKLRQSTNASDEATLQVLNYAAATQWARDVAEEAGPEYEDAVSWCLHNVPDSGNVKGKEDRWREDMYVNVVEKLKCCHDKLAAV